MFCSLTHSRLCFELGLSYDTNETVLKNAFEQYGDLIQGNPYIV